MSILVKYISTDFIVLPMQASDSNSALQELLRPLEEHHILEPDQACLESILRRERRMSTGVGKGVALPHGLSDQITDVAVVIGISPGGINFRAVDNMLCHIFVLLISPRDQPEKHLKLLSRFTKLLSGGQLRSTLLEARTAEDLLDTLQDWDDKENDVLL